MSTPSAAAGSLGRDAQAISLVTVAHFMSHFYQLVLPPLFPMLALHYGVGYVELGLVITGFSLASGIAQTPIGFLVDRFGGRFVLIAGLAMLGAAVAGYGLAHSYWALLGLAVVGGVANAVFHPADYSILSASVDPKRLARAFGLHAVSGNLGWAAAPAVVLGLHTWVGLQQTLVTVGAAGVLLALFIATQSWRMRDEASVRKAAAGVRDEGETLSALQLLTSRPIVMCFTFQLVHSMAAGGIRTFGIVALAALYGLSVDDPQYAVIGTALTIYLVTGSLGNLVGGSVIDRTGRPGVVYAGSILTVFVLVVAMGTGAIWLNGALAMLAVAGLFQGSLLPARDVLVRAVSPPGQLGKVFGFTSSGLSLGNALMPPLFGWLLDSGDPGRIFYVSGAFMLLALATYTETSRHARR